MGKYCRKRMTSFDLKRVIETRKSQDYGENEARIHTVLGLKYSLIMGYGVTYSSFVTYFIFDGNMISIINNK